MKQQINERKNNLSEYELMNDKEAQSKNDKMIELFKLNINTSIELKEILEISYNASDDPFDPRWCSYYKACFMDGSYITFGLSDIEDVLKDYNGIITRNDIRNAKII